MSSAGVGAYPRPRIHVPAARVPVDEIRSAREPVRIVIIEPHRFLADALKALMSRQPGMVVAGTVGSVADFAPLAAELRPDIVIVDFRLTDSGASDAVRTMFDAGSQAKVIFLTNEETDQVLLAAIDAGASAVLNLSSAADDVIHTVRMVAEGGSLIPPGKIATLLDGRRRTDIVRDKLTGRETEILGLMADGMSNREIAAQLGISYNTVRCHVRNLSSKLAAHSKLEVLVKAE
ncbi:MAG: LuxR C-terminal-related transcriptional regulator, partial [Candidatus Dormibacteraceae bacterium]